MAQTTAYLVNFYDKTTGTYKAIPAFKGDKGEKGESVYMSVEDETLVATIAVVANEILEL